MKFLKMHGLGNDFIIFDARQKEIVLSKEQMQKISNRHFGIGCDLITIIDKSEKADIYARFINADGSESGACGNATRCVADIIFTETGKSECKVEVVHGILHCRKVDDLIQVDMGKALTIQDMDISEGGLSQPIYVDMGNPHCVFFIESLDKVKSSLETIGKTIENHDLFPNRTNVEFVEVHSIDKSGQSILRQITWERGCGFTLACGSGACASVVAAAHRNLIGNKAEVILDGGSLNLEINQDTQHIYMTGPISYVFEGKLHTAF